MQEQILTGRIAGLVIFRLSEFGRRASFRIECAERGPVICCIAGDVPEEFITHFSEGDMVAVRGIHEARPSTAPTNVQWAGRFRVRAVCAAEGPGLAALRESQTSELREAAK
jgi:hypothetical protein